MARPFTSWREFAEFVVLLGVCVAGVVNASCLWGADSAVPTAQLAQG